MTTTTHIVPLPWRSPARALVARLADVGARIRTTIYGPAGRIVCAYCRATLGPVWQTGGRDSHGICPACRRRLMGGAR